MPKKSRRFDKKNATHLELIFNQPRAEFPSQRTIDEEREQEAKDKENGYRYEDWVDAEYGFPDDGYDYSQHFMPMGNGVFISPDGNVEDKIPIYDARSIMPENFTDPTKRKSAPKKVVNDSDEPDELIDVVALSKGRQKKNVPMISRDKVPNRVGANDNLIENNNNTGMVKDFILAVVERDDLDIPRDDDDENQQQKIRITDDDENEGHKPEKLSKVINVFEPQEDFESQQHLYKNLSKPLDKDIERALNEGSIDQKYKSTIKMLKEKEKQKNFDTKKNHDDVTDDVMRDIEEEEEEDYNDDDDDNDYVIEEMPDDFITQLMEGNDEFEDDDFFDNYQEGDDIDGFYYDDDDEYYDEEDGDDEQHRRGNRKDDELEDQLLDDLLDEYDDYGDLSGDEETCGTMSIQSILAHLEADDARKDSKKERARLTKYHLEAKRNQKLGLEAIVDEDFSAKPTAEQSDKTRELINLQETKKEKEFIEVDDDDDRDEEKWDCESILSTYSSHMNKPKVLIDDIDKKKKKSKKAQNTQKIEISKKTGLPVEILKQQQLEREQQMGIQQQQQQPEERVNLGEKRKKGMTAEEKRQRKKALKEEKREKRAQKKELKLAYKTAEATQIKTLQNSNINNYTTVHYN